jgi:hypothetical protein
MHVKITGSILLEGKFVKPGSVVDLPFHLAVSLVQRGDAVEASAPASAPAAAAASASASAPEPAPAKAAK